MIHSMAVTGTAAAAHRSSTLITAAMTERSGIATSATITVAAASLISHRCTPAPALGAPAARSWLTVRAAAICSAEPGTIMMMKAESSTASEP